MKPPLPPCAAPKAAAGGVASMSDERTVIGNDELIRAGTQLNHMYEIEDHIASGGMGEVYKGHELGTGEKVAIKIVLPSLARDPSMMQLFIKEAAVLRRLSHPAIVRYLSFGADREINRHFIAMEFVDGESLARRVEARGPLSPEEARLLMMRVASGLAVAHEAGIVHRDMSPDNVILPEGSVAQCKIIDFGIAKAGDIGGKTVIDGRFAGKTNFVSPEQLGLYGPVTGKSDIYSLGLVMATALLGAPLDMGGLPVQAAEKRRAVPDLSPIQPELADVLAAMLQPQPADRPESGDVVEWLREMGRAALPTRAPLPAPVHAGRSAPSAPPSGSVAPAGSLPQAFGQPPATGSWAPPSQPAAALAFPAVAQPPFAGSSPPSHSPFGPPPPGYGSSQPPVFGLPPAAALPLPAPAVPARKRGKGPLVVLAVLLLCAGGGAAAYLGGVFGPGPSSPTPEPPASTAPAVPPSEPQVPTQPKAEAPEPEAPATLPPAISVDRAGDVMEASLRAVEAFDGGLCFHAGVTAVSDKRIAITGFARSDEPFNRLLAAVREETGIEPDISVRAVDERQCPVVDFLRASAATASPPLSLDRDRLEVSQSLSGKAEVPDDAALNLLYIDQDGFVQNMKRLVRNTRPGERSFSFTLRNSKPEAEPQPQLIVLLSSRAGIPSADITQPERAETLFPKILAAIRGGSALTGASVAYFKIIPRT